MSFAAQKLCFFERVLLLYGHTSYIDVFLKVKQESSGYPDWCKTEQDKEIFKRNYLNAEGISLESVEKNPGLRAVAKILCK